MALPTAITDSVDGLITWFGGPYIDGSDVYVHAQFIDVDQIHTDPGPGEAAEAQQESLFKSTNPDTTAFTTIDQTGELIARAGNFDEFRGPKGIRTSSWQDGDIIHIAFYHNGGDEVGGAGRERYGTFDTSTDEWVVGTEALGQAIRTSVSQADNQPLVQSVKVRSDGDVLAVGGTTDTSDMGTPYGKAGVNRRESGVWTINIRLDDQGKEAVHYGQPAITHGGSANDRMHCTYRDDTSSGTVRLSTYLSDNTFGVQNVSVATGVTGYTNHGVAFDRSSTQIVRIPYSGVSSVIAVMKFDDADSPSVTVETGAADNAHIEFAIDIGDPNVNASGDFSLDVLNGVQHLVFARASDNDIYHTFTGAGDDTWNTDTKVQTLGTDTRRCQGRIFNRGGEDVFAYAYWDDTNNTEFFYNEINSGGGLGGAGGSFPPINKNSFTHMIIR